MQAQIFILHKYTWKAQKCQPHCTPDWGRAESSCFCIVNVIRLALRFMCMASSITKVELLGFAGSCIRFKAIALRLECADSLFNSEQWIYYGSFEAKFCIFLSLTWVCSIFRMSRLHLCSLSSSLIWNVVCDLRLIFACISIAHYHQKFRKQALRTFISFI